MVRRPHFRGDLMLVMARALSRQARLETPEQQLWFAVLLQAIRDCGYPSADARRAFLAGELNWLCALVGLTPGYVIRLIREAGGFDLAVAHKIQHTSPDFPTMATAA